MFVNKSMIYVIIFNNFQCLRYTLQQIIRKGHRSRVRLGSKKDVPTLF